MLTSKQDLFHELLLFFSQITVIQSKGVVIFEGGP